MSNDLLSMGSHLKPLVLSIGEYSQCIMENTQVCMMAKVDEDTESSSDHSDCGSEVRTLFNYELFQSLKAQVQFMKEEFENLKVKLSHERQTMLNFRDENAMLKDVVKEKESEKEILKKDKDVLKSKISELERDLVNLNAEKGKVVNDDETSSCADSISSFKSVGFTYKDLNECYKTRKPEFSEFSSLFSPCLPTESAKVEANSTESQCQYDESDSETDVENQISLSDSFTSNSSKESKGENIMNQNLNSDFSKIMTEEIFTEMMNASDPVPIIKKMESNSEVNQASIFEKQITDLQKTIEELEDENIDLRFKLDKSSEENKELSRELKVLKDDLFKQNLKEKKIFESLNWNVHSNPEFETINSKTSVVYTTTPEYPPSIFEKGETSCTSKPKLSSTKKANKILFHELNVKMTWKCVPKPRYEWRIKAKASHTWYIDSGCSRHMAGFKHLLHNYVEEPVDKDGRAVFKAKRNANLYSVNFPTLSASRPVCLIAKASRAESWIWHQRLSHQNFDAMNQLVRQGIVKGLPELRFEKNSLCPACEMGKMKRTSHKAKTEFSSSTPLELIHMDLCGPMRTQSINDKRYILVMIDEYSRYTWLEFLRNKSDVTELIIAFIKKIQVRLQLPVKSLRSDNGTEFKNEKLHSYLVSVGISHNFSFAHTPQQNGVVERKNRTLVEAARTMCYILNDRDNLANFDKKADE
ncbi:hypothetical protein L6452_09345 [Arctium lappa]|uniref:Uncharacterized protein n=1 Tax=Arctium lappa TaxID=4217 RepID=A0ACB9DJR8_ARCLA|nr:hypothetical protein L6452_09345 [Arctium lappa]